MELDFAGLTLHKGKSAPSQYLQEHCSAFLKTYKLYIRQAETDNEHKERISRMVCFCAEKSDSVLQSLGKDKFFFQAWLKYARSVADKEDVLDYMLEKHIGADFADLYNTVAVYAEDKMKDLRKADAVLRQGLSYLSSQE